MEYIISTTDTNTQKTDLGTYCSKKKPVIEKGTIFELFHVTRREPRTRNLPNTALELFKLLDNNIKPQRRQSGGGCLDCNVALCNSDKCWYMWHS